MVPIISQPKTRLLKQLLGYCAVGACGLLVEIAVVALLQYRYEWSAIPCRAVSFPAAVLVTWWLNHRYTFSSTGGWSELLRYLGTQGLGLSVNLLAYIALSQVVDEFDRRALVPLLVGSALGLLVNFTLAKRLVFHRTGQ